MRATAICWAVLAACALGTACGGDDKAKDGDTTGDAGDGNGGAGTAGSSSNRAGSTPAGGKGLVPAGGTNPSGGANPGGSSNAMAGEAPTDAGAGPTGEGGAGGEQPEPPGPKAIEFSVVGNEAVHPISPLIYGANMDGLACANSKARFTFCRHRSAAWSTYNWETNASNAGIGDCNENNDALSASSSPADPVTKLIAEADGVGAGTIVTVPMLPYVAKDKLGGSASPDCSGDVSKTANYLSTRFLQNRPRKGSALASSPDTSDGYVNQDEFIAFLHDGYAASKLMFSLDTQPELWFQEHPKLQPAQLTYAEQLAMSIDYSKMIKDNWSGAPVLGLVGYGYLAAVSQQNSPDYLDKGDFYDYYLQQFSEASATDNRRLLDYMDLHWFPELYPDNQRVIEESTTEASVKTRVQAPRSLWDPNFDEKTWVSASNGGPIELLPWLKASIDQNYPGTKLSLSEWSYGGAKHISGAIAAADALGIYGQQGVDLAGVVSFSPDTADYLVGAFEAYRNYDGQAHGFGDTSVAATSSNVAHGSIYASVDSSDSSRMVLVVINRYAYELDASLTIDHDVSYASLKPYVISDGHPDPVAGAVIDAVTPNHFDLTLPPYTVWVLVPAQ